MSYRRKLVDCFGAIVVMALGMYGCQGSYEKDPFVTPDLSFFGLRGHVKSVSYEDNGELVFSSEGVLVSEDGKNPFSRYHYVRGDKEMSDYIVANRDYPDEEYVWKDGRVVHSTRAGEGEYSETDYSYDENGDLKSAKTVRREASHNPPPAYEATVTFNILKDDEHGNWIERECVCTHTAAYYAGVKVEEAGTDRDTLVRSITYYDE